MLAIATFCTAGGFKVDGDVGVIDPLFQLFFNAVGNIVCLLYCFKTAKGEMEVDHSDGTATAGA